MINTRPRTHEDSHLVGPLSKNVVIIPRPELVKGRKTSRSHPYLEVLVCSQIGRWIVGRVSIGILECPVGRWYELGDVIARRLDISFCLARPYDTALRKNVYVALDRRTALLDLSEITERV